MGVIPEIGTYWSSKPSRDGCQLIRVVGYEEKGGIKTVTIERLKSRTGGEPTRKRGRVSPYYFHGTYIQVSPP